MIETTRAIVLRTIKYRDTSVIVDAFTEQFGLKTYIINGVYKTKPRFPPSLLQLGAVLQMVVYNKEGRQMNRVKEIQADFYASATINELRRSAVKLFMIELSRKTLRFDVAQPELFEEIRDLIYRVEYDTEDVVNYHLYYLVRLLIHLGIFPDLSYWPQKKILSVQEGSLFHEAPPKGLAIPANVVETLIALNQSTPENLHEIKMNRKQRQNFIEHMLSYYSYHLENFSQMNTHLIYKKLL